MIRYAATVSYDGGEYSGWQRQPNAMSVQEMFEESLFTLCGDDVRVTAAGRTDAGVHSRGQVVSFVMNREWEEDRLLLAINAHLSPSVRVARIRKVPADFNARRSAQWREYRYFIWHGNFCYPHISRYVWWNRRYWNMTRIREACRILEGEHDFKAFCRVSECPENSIRNILKFKVHSRGNVTVFQVRGNAFLTNMVRIMIGNIHLIGIEKHDTEWLKNLLDGKSRIFSGVTAPARGLFFWSVGYDIFSS